MRPLPNLCPLHLGPDDLQLRWCWYALPASHWLGCSALRFLIRPIQIKRKRLIRIVQQLTPRRWHLVPLDTVLAEVDFLAVQRVRVPRAGGVAHAGDAVQAALARSNIRHDNALNLLAARATWQPLPQFGN